MSERSSTPRKAKTPREKMTDYRARMRAKGMRPIQIWVPDVHAPGFREECTRQARLVSQSPEEKAVLEFFEAVSDWDELPPFEWNELASKDKA